MFVRSAHICPVFGWQNEQAKITHITININTFISVVSKNEKKYINRISVLKYEPTSFVRLRLVFLISLVHWNIIRYLHVMQQPATPVLIKWINIQRYLKCLMLSWMHLQAIFRENSFLDGHIQKHFCLREEKMPLD